MTKQGENVQGDPIYLALERKVPKHILRKIFEKKSTSANWSTNQFCAALNEIVKSENELNAIYANDSDSRKEHEERKPNLRSERREREQGEPSKRSSREIVFAATARNPTKSENKYPPCCFCGGEHSRIACRVYDTFEKRLEKAKTLKLCFNCLNTGHMTVRCPRGKFTCRNCERPHNTALCNKMKNVAAKNAEIASITTGMTIAQSKHALEEGEALLMLIKGKVFNPLAPDSSADAWIFLDPGSTRSFIFKRLADELGIITQNTDYFNLIGFNEPEGKMYESNVLTFGIKLKNEQAINMQANCIPLIVRDLTTIPLSGNSEAGFMSGKHKAETPDILI